MHFHCADPREICQQKNAHDCYGRCPPHLRRQVTTSSFLESVALKGAEELQAADSASWSHWWSPTFNLQCRPTTVRCHVVRLATERGEEASVAPVGCGRRLPSTVGRRELAAQTIGAVGGPASSEPQGKRFLACQRSRSGSLPPVSASSGDHTW